MVRTDIRLGILKKEEEIVQMRPEEREQSLRLTDKSSFSRVTALKGRGWQQVSKKGTKKVENTRGKEKWCSERRDRGNHSSSLYDHPRKTSSSESRAGELSLRSG